MAQHDYNIANQTAPAFRTDLNNALAALASTSSGATAPATTYANMLWYDTAANILKMRNEADSAWINLLALDQGANTAQPSTLPFSSQSQAENGTNNTTVMTPLRTEQHKLANAIGWGQTWQDVSVSRAINTAYQNTTGRPIMVAVHASGLSGAQRYGVSSNNSTWIQSGDLNSDGDDQEYNFEIIVPPTWYYRLTAAGINALTWLELR